ncbi:MAG: hypothetical protein ACRDGQ_06700 [Candidatus Limnocylindrales bacterium]
MSVARAMAEISSAEYGEWVAWYILEAEEQDPDREPSPDELSVKMAAWAASRQAR